MIGKTKSRAPTADRRPLAGGLCPAVRRLCLASGRFGGLLFAKLAPDTTVEDEIPLAIREVRQHRDLLAIL